MERDKEMNRAFRIALACGVLPLLTGVSIFVLWLATRWDWLQLAGVWALFGGGVLVLVGVLALVRFHLLASTSQHRSRRRLWSSTLACAAVLLANFPVAGGIVAGVVAIEARYTVVIDNASQQHLERVTLSGGDWDAQLGSIPPGRTVRHSFWVQHEGALELRAVSGTLERAQLVDGYVTPGMGGRATITIAADGTVSVELRSASD